MKKRPRNAQPFRRTPLALATHLLLATIALPALAQEAPEGAARSATDLDTVTVTATRREESVQEVPINITAVTGTDIEQQGLKDLADLVRTVPGLFLVDQGGRDANKLVVRGLNVDSLAGYDGNIDGGGVVAQYIGDIPLFMDFRLIDIDRVEALLGPQGTLYGAGTLGGAIRYLPARPVLGETSFVVGGGLNVMSKSDDVGSEARFTVNLPVGEKGAFRAAVAYVEDPGFIDYGYVVREGGVSNPQPDPSDPADVAANLRYVKDANYTDVLTSRLGFRYEFTPSVTADLSYYYQKQEAGGRTINHREAFGTGRYVSAQRYLEPNDRENHLLSLELNADLGFATLTSATGYSEYTDDGQRDQTDLLLNFEYGYEDFPTFSAFTHEETEQKRYNQELRLVSNTEGPWNWIVGAFYNRADTYGTSIEYTPGLPAYWGVDRPDEIEYYSLADTRFEERALFGELDYDITDKWSVTVGARRFDYKVDATSGFDLPLLYTALGERGPTEIVPALEAVRVSDKDSIFKFNTAYQFNDRLLGYFTVSEGYRPGGSNVIPSCPDPLPPEQNVCALPNELLIQPDKTRNHEIGIKSSWLDGRLVVNGALYYIDWEDIQVAGTTVNGNLPITVNGGTAESRGVELSVAARLLEGLRANFSYSYNQAELTQDAIGIVGGQDALDGDRLPGSPEQQANLSLNYYRPLANGWAWSMDYSVHAQGDVYSRVGLRNNGEILPGYSTHNVAWTLFGDKWDVRLYVRNLFDKYAATGIRSTPAFIRSIDGDPDGDGVADYSFALRSYYKAVLEPRRVGVDFTYRF
ncbi:TonB-dependent receptor [Pseudoxanthomonas sp. PXM02]|uniref:TonB-dependent receptor n=1 Tax=Pseudoxanthomonas sp. PXM02 TaxID=2769294 RepID=UPI00178769CA|nr:TonB-dependent receptor [Pseudoxanthomonas sp. PXM02]MBD9480924.1 TonB-dependent receptor [Pseudoxanthomonas sp. PXM02]